MEMSGEAEGAALSCLAAGCQRGNADARRPRSPREHLGSLGGDGGSGLQGGSGCLGLYIK